jgi:hypothetical protein
MAFVGSCEILKEGDFVLYDSNSKFIIWKITKIERRFLTEDDVKRYTCYNSCSVGDEYAPLVTISFVKDISNVTKKKRSHILDASYLKKVNSKQIEDSILKQIEKLNNMLSEFKTLDIQPTDA